MDCLQELKVRGARKGTGGGGGARANGLLLRAPDLTSIEARGGLNRTSLGGFGSIHAYSVPPGP